MATTRTKSPELVKPGGTKTPTLLEVVLHVLGHIRSEYFSSVKESQAAVPLEKAIVAAGYEADAKELLALLKRLGACQPTGGREHQGPLVYAVWTAPDARKYLAPAIVNRVWEELQKDKTRDAELRRLRAQAASPTQSVAPSVEPASAPAPAAAPVVTAPSLEGILPPGYAEKQVALLKKMDETITGLEAAKASRDERIEELQRQLDATRATLETAEERLGQLTEPATQELKSTIDDLGSKYGVK